MTNFLLKTRYLILIPILGLALAAAFFFIFGGVGLIRLLVELVSNSASGNAVEPSHRGGIVIFEVVEYVHTFLIGTVLYITAVGLFQLFIKEIDFPGWLKIDSTEELETNLIGVTVVVLAVNFMGAMFAGGLETANLLNYGVAIALPIAALGVFVALRAWSSKTNKEADRITRSEQSSSEQNTATAGAANEQIS
ncbi:MAG: YqhA family protein [Candidatus Promineifilaceae bacterium]|nr:YqhA family protein [Candidatus Promineifilaceae bacterium]